MPAAVCVCVQLRRKPNHYCCCSADGPGRFNILPLVLQASPASKPDLFEIPEQYITGVLCSTSSRPPGIS